MKIQIHNKLSYIVLIFVLAFSLLDGVFLKTAYQGHLDPQTIFDDRPAIWVDHNLPSSPIVVLFRRSFYTFEPTQAVELEIFADTRYEVWVDGSWIGRGPARFSSTLREFDQYLLGQLRPGKHCIAVLVQWAPNIRRSESTMPMLFARILTAQSWSGKTLIKTGKDWKAIVAEAWREDAAPVHDWGLIGPTELLDLRRLPADWQMTDYPDQEWQNAVVLDHMGDQDIRPIYRPRSIAFLAEYQMPIVIKEAGLISPDCSMVEISPPFSEPYLIPIQVNSPSILTIETLSITSSISTTASIDGLQLSWNPSIENRLDVYQAAAPVKAGRHQIALAHLPDQGMTFCISNHGLANPIPELEQGNHAGRRLSLARLLPDPDQIVTHQNAAGIDLEFSRLPAYVILDVGRTIHGRIYLEVEGASGSIVDIGWDERLRTNLGRPYPYLGSLYPSWNQVDSWVLDGTRRSIWTIDARAGRYILIAIWGKGPVRLTGLQALEERYPLEQIGEFHSSDPLLDTIWQVGVNTLLPNLSDGFTDTPWRERGQWWGDVYAENRIAQVVFRDTSLLRRGLIFMADEMGRSRAPGLAPNNQGHHMLDYAMLWVSDLSGYLQVTGDQALAREVFPQLKQLMDHLSKVENQSSGLIDLPKQHWSTTAYLDVNAAQSRFGESTAINAIYYETLKQAAWIANFVGNPVLAKKYWKNSERVHKAINKTLYQEETYLYLTRRFEGVFYKPTIYSQAWALAYDIIPEERRKMATEALSDLISPDPKNAGIGTYGMFWLLAALGKAGDYQRAVDLISNYYGFILESGDQTWWEGFHAGSYPETSISHGWSGAPTWFLSTYILGARKNGAEEWQVSPSFSGVQSAAGVFPLPNGVLEIRWRNLGCGESELSISAPRRTRGEAIFPRRWNNLSLVLNGEQIWADDQPGSAGAFLDSQGLHVPLNDGLHEFTARYNCIQQ